MFPKGKHDDQVDAASGAFNKMARSGRSGGALMARYRRGGQVSVRRAGINAFGTLGLWFKALRGKRYAITAMNSNGVEVTQMVDYNTYCEEGYKRNATLFACVRMLATSAPTARMQVQRRLTRGQTEIFEGHPLQAVFGYAQSAPVLLRFHGIARNLLQPGRECIHPDRVVIRDALMNYGCQDQIG